MKTITTTQVLSLSLACLVTIWVTAAHAQRLATKELSSGACMVVCNDVSFCMNFSYNDQTGTCTLFMDPNKRKFVQLEQSCPRTPVSHWVVSMDQEAEKWTIECPDTTLKPHRHLPPICWMDWIKAVQNEMTICCPMRISI